MKFKYGVQFNYLQVPMFNALTVIEAAFNYFDSQLVITSGSEGKHMKGSKHPIGGAVDCRTRHLTLKIKRWIVERLKRDLSPKFDIVRHRTHIHIEMH